MKIQNPYFRNWLLDPVSKIIIRLPLKLNFAHFVKDECIQKVEHSKLYVPGGCTFLSHQYFATYFDRVQNLRIR